MSTNKLFYFGGVGVTGSLGVTRCIMSQETHGVLTLVHAAADLTGAPVVAARVLVAQSERGAPSPFFFGGVLSTPT